jgi:hypothetical protein
LKVENGAFAAGSTLRFVTGAQGSTGVYGAALNAPIGVEASTGIGGKCEAFLNRVTSPSIRLCQ